MGRGDSAADSWVDPPVRTWEDVVHPNAAVVRVLDGEPELEVEGAFHRPRAGEELLIPAGANRTAGNVGRTTSGWPYGYRNS